jgi:hypothetical protein
MRPVGKIAAAVRLNARLAGKIKEEESNPDGLSLWQEPGVAAADRLCPMQKWAGLDAVWDLANAVNKTEQFSFHGSICRRRKVPIKVPYERSRAGRDSIAAAIIPATSSPIAREAVAPGLGAFTR